MQDKQQIIYFPFPCHSFEQSMFYLKHTKTKFYLFEKGSEIGVFKHILYKEFLLKRDRGNNIPTIFNSVLILISILNN